MSEAAIADLVEAARAGDGGAMDALYRRFAPVVHGVLLGYVQRADADDLTQDVFETAIRRLHELRESAAFPDKFKPGAKLKACMVYLAPDKAALEAVSFRPEQEFNPIIWEGEVVPADTGEKKSDDKKSDDKKDEKKKSDG